MKESTTQRVTPEAVRFRWHRLAAALGIGLGIGALEAILINFLPPRWSDLIGDLPLQPAGYLVTLLAKAVPLGFEGQVFYFFLAVVLQWLVYTGVVYLMLAISGKKQDAASGR